MLTKSKQTNKQFVLDDLALSLHEPPEPSPVRKQSSEDPKGLYMSMQEVADRRFSHQVPTNHMSGTRLPIDTRGVKLHKFQSAVLSVSQVETMLFNTFNSLRVLIESNLLCFEKLKDHTSGEETRDLVALLRQIDQTN